MVILTLCQKRARGEEGGRKGRRYKEVEGSKNKGREVKKMEEKQRTMQCGVLFEISA